MDLLALLYELLAKARKEGMMKMAHEGITVFLCDYLRLVISGNTDAHEIEALMDHEIETIRHEAEVPGHSLSRVADALPALGIVAAVMGVVHALASADLPPSEMGALIAHAMVGTFLGVLLAYGFVSPLATLIEQKVEEGMKIYQCAKVTLLRRSWRWSSAARCCSRPSARRSPSWTTTSARSRRADALLKEERTSERP